MYNKKSAKVNSVEKLLSFQEALNEAVSAGLIEGKACTRIYENSLIIMKKKKSRSYWGEEPVEEEPVIIPEPAPAPAPEPYYIGDVPTVVEVPAESPEPPPPDCCEPPAEEAIIIDELVDGQVIETLPVSTEGLEAYEQSQRSGEHETDGYGFLCCFRCGKIDLIQYGERKLPAIMAGEEPGSDACITMILCGGCRTKNTASYGTKMDGVLASTFATLKLNPVIFVGTEVYDIARVIRHGRAEFIMVGEGVAYRDVDRIVKALTEDDKINSVDVASFRRGEKDNLLLPYLRGGLAS